jgi:arabinofuranosyltransferase
MTRTKIILLSSGFAFIAIIAFLRSNYTYTTIVDDAYIFFRYAENIVNGYGFVWNINEQPIEGYSSFLYLVVLIFAKLLTIDVEFFSIIFGVLTSSFTLYLTFLIYQLIYHNQEESALSKIVTVVIIAISPAFLYWSVTGMETSFYSMFLLLTIYYFLKLPNSIKTNLLKGILFGFLCVLRFEAAIFFLAALYYLVKDEKSLLKIKIDRRAIMFVLGFTIIFGTYFLWRWNYFGYFFPNTYYAKTGGGLQQVAGGFFYSIKALRLFYGFAWIPLVIVIFFFKKNMFTDKAVFLFSFGIISLVTTILIGGDHFHYGRFVLPVLPLLFIFFPPAFDKMLSAEIKYFKLKSKYRAAIILIVLVSLLVSKPVYLETLGGFRNLLQGKKEILIVYDESIEIDIIEWQHGFYIMGETLKAISSKDDYIAAVPIGAIGYYSKIKVIDMVGLVDPVIAHKQLSPESMRKWTPGHTKGDGKYILSKKPKYIQLTDYLTRSPLEKPHERSTQFVSVKEIWESDEFRSDYEFYPIEVLDGWYYNIFKRNNFK